MKSKKQKREEALIRREKNVVDWERLHSAETDPERKEALSKKISRAKIDIHALESYL